jgi:hypothetical protein
MGMTLLGTGVLAIWNGMEAGADDEFLEWHVQQHIPERVGVPGFLRGRRYAAQVGFPPYFNFYEVESPQVLTSSAYRERLDHPTPWTRSVIARFCDTSRTACRVHTSLGRGEGSWIETVRLAARGAGEGFGAALAGRLLPALLARRGIVAVHLLQGLPDASRTDSAEKTLRGQPDQLAAWILLVEGVDAASLDAARGAVGSDRALQALGAADGSERGTYRLEFALGKAELAQGPAATPPRWEPSAGDV